MSAVRMLCALVYAFFGVLLMGQEECVTEQEIDNDGDGWSLTTGDCDDADASVCPGATERCGDGIDQDCNGSDFQPTLYVSIEGYEIYSSIQDAIEDANEGDCIWVEAGTYHERINFLGKNVEVVGAEAATTIIQPLEGGSAVTFEGNETSAAVLEHVTITNGSGTPLYNNYATGGGILIVDSSPTIRENLVVENTSYYGGGIAVIGGAPMITGNSIRSNVAMHHGGGLFLDDTNAVVQHNLFSDNTADGLGGGVMATESTLNLQYNSVLENVATKGGGLYLSESAGALHNSTVYGNNADYGAGGYVYESPVTLENVLIDHNWTDVAGGGLYLFSTQRITLRNTTVAYNCADDIGDGIYNRANLVLDSSIVAFNDCTGTNLYNPSTYTVDLQYSLFCLESMESGVSGTTLDATNLIVDPLFVSSQDCHLQSASPAINTGNPDSTHDDTDDTRNDMGAYGGPLGSW